MSENIGLKNIGKKEYVEKESLAKHIDNSFGEISTPFVVKEIRNFPVSDVVKIPEGGIGNLSDGYHTFNELYHHRAILFSVICNAMPAKAWKSKLHDTGDMFDGMFIVGIETPDGQATYHYDIDPYWDMFKVKELEKAPKWDGHTPQDAIERISKLSAGINSGVDANKWIPITSEKKPSHLRNYFIAYVFGDSDMYFFSEAEYHAYGGNGIVEGPHFSNEGIDDMRVTHWMPIPTLPKESEDVNT